MSRTVKPPEVRRKEIVTAARQLFQEKGYDKTSVQEVIDQLGLSKGAIYYHFKSKEEVLEAVIDDIVNDGVEQMQAKVNGLNESALDTICCLIPTRAVFGNDAATLSQLNRPENAGMYARIVLKALQKQAPIFAQLVQRGCDEGVFKTNTPLETAEFIITAVQFLLDQGIYEWSQEAIVRRLQSFPSIIETMLHAPDGSFDFLSKMMPR